MASQTQQLENPAPPGLGYPTETYERRHFNENNGALTVYFKKLSFVLGSLFGPKGGRFMNNPYGAFQEEHGWAVEYEAIDLDDEEFEDTEEEEATEV